MSTPTDSFEGSNIQQSSGASSFSSPSGLDGAVTIVHVSGLHSDITDEDLEAYFETPRSGGKRGSVVQCIFEEGGTARVEFNDPEVAASVASMESHSIVGQNFIVELNLPRKHDSYSTILVSTPLDVDQALLQRRIEKQIGPGFSIKQQGHDSYILTTDERELDNIIEKLRCIKIAGSPLSAQLYAAHLMKGTASMWPHETEHLEESSGTNGESFRLCHAVLVLSNLSPTKLDYARCFYEDLLKLKHEDDFLLEQQGDSDITLTFKKCLTQKELNAIIKLINESKMKNCNIHCEVVNMCPFTMPREILVSGIPSGCAVGYFEAYVEQATGMKPDADFTLTQHFDTSLLIMLKKSYNMQEFSAIVRKIMETKIRKTVSLMAEPHWTLEEVQCSAFNSGPVQIVISNMPTDNVTLGHLEFFLEQHCGMPDDGSCSLKLQEDGSALLSFISNPLKTELMDIIAAINTKPFKGVMLNAVLHSSTAPNKPEVSTTTAEQAKLLITIPDSCIELHILEVTLEAAVSMECNEDFTLEKLSDNMVAMNFQKQFSNDALGTMITEIEKKKMKGQFLKARISIACQPVLRIKNLSGDIEEDFLKDYFKNKKRSGGGDIELFEMSREREAIVKFCDPNAIECVLKKTHETLGKGVTLMKDWASNSEFTNAESNLHLPMSIPLSPSLACFLKNDITRLQNILDDLNVQVAIDEHDAIVASPSRLTKDGWEVLCREKINTYIKANVAEASLDISHKALSLLLPSIIGLQKSDKCFSYNPPVQGRSPLHHFVGHPNVIQKIRCELENINAQITVTTAQVDLGEMKFAFIVQLKQQDILSTYPSVKVRFNPPNTVTLGGTVQDINIMKDALSNNYACNSAHVDLTNQEVFEFLQTDAGQDELKTFISTNFQCSAAVCVTRSGGIYNLHLLSEPQNLIHIKKAADAIPTEFCSKQIPIGALYAHFHLDDQDIAEYKELCKQHGLVFIQTTNQAVQIIGFKHAVDKCFLSLKAFIDKKCEVAKTVMIEPGMWRLFKGPLLAKWNSVAAVKVGTEVIKIVNPEDDGEKCVLQLLGRIDVVQCVQEKIHKLIESVVVKQIPITRPHIKEYMKKEVVCSMIRGVESEYRVCIETTEDTELSEEVEYIPKIDGHREVLVACTKELKKVVVCIGNITEFNKADVLVNAANSELQHIGGVAKAFVDKGGPIIQQTSTKYCKNHGRLSDGDVWLTTDVGELPCKALIHAVGPKWNHDKNSEKSLFSAFFKSLKFAKSYKSIAFPAIGTGVYGCPYDVCAKCWIDAVVSFVNAEPSSPLSEIYFVAHDASSAEHVVKTIKSQSSSSMFTIVSPAGMLDASDKPIRQRTHIPSLQYSGKSSTSHNIDYLKLQKGSLLDVKADVYVNTTNEQLSLSAGAVSAMIAKAAGPKLQQECSQKAPVRLGDVAVTGPGDLKCKNVFHIVVCHYDGPGGKAEKILQQSIKNCLTECNRLQISSIAFPALGTGALKFPPDVSAELMIAEIVDFMKQNHSFIKTVYIVIYQDSMLSTFQSVLSRPRSSAYRNDEGHVVKPTKSKPSKGNPIATSSAPGAYTLDSITINIIQGDITDESSDAVVNSTSEGMTLVETGVCGALLRKAGSGLQSDCDAYIAQHQGLKYGDVATTPAHGSLKCKTIFHVNYDPKSKLCPETVLACLTKAEELRYSTISFPALGTGNHQCSPDRAADMIRKGIKLFVTGTRTSHNLKSIRIVIFQPEIYKPFVEVFNKLIQSSDPWYQKLYNRTLGYYLGSSTAEQKEDDSVEKLDHFDNNFITTSVCLNIYGETNEFVNAAEQKVCNIIDHNFASEVINNDLINDIPKSDLEALIKFSEENGVELSIDRAPLNQIKLHGETHNFSKCHSHVLSFLHSHQSKAQMLERAELLQMRVEWQRQCSDGTYSPYETLLNYDIEKEHEQNKTEYINNDKQDYFRIDFEKGLEFDAHGQMTARVKRVDKAVEGYPAHWDPMPLDQSKKEVQCHVVDLSSSCKEYSEVMADFSRSMTQGKNFNQVLKIQRIQNPTLYGQYVIRKKAMDKQNPHCQNERKLFHGTKADICEKINVQGFNRSFSGRNATAFGLGAYFARDASYSAQDKYSNPDALGHKRMYLAGVLTGEYALGKEGMIVPPPKDPKDVNLLFESVVNDVQNPIIFVTFFDAQAYPEYLITFY